MAGVHRACYTQVKSEFHFKCLCDAALIQLEMAVVMRGRGDWAFRIRHTDLEIGARLFKKVIGKIFAAQGVRAFINGISEIFCDTADSFDFFRHIDGGRIAKRRCHVAGESETGADAFADGMNGVEDFIDQLII